MKKIILVFSIIVSNMNLMPLGPTHEHLTRGSSIFKIKPLRDEIWKNQKLIDTILQNEKKMSDKFFVLYHAQSNLLFFQDLIDELRSCPEDSNKDFFFLRIPKSGAYSNVNSFMQDEHRWDDDSKEEISRHILSVNLSLFGNEKNQNSCTLAFWLLNKRSNPVFDRKKWLLEILSAFEIPEEKFFSLFKLYEKYNDETLLQIFIPKNKKKDFDQSFYFSMDGGKVHKKLEGISLSQIIESSEAKHNYEDLEARILLNNEFFLNPQSGIKFKRYVKNLTEKEYIKYRAELKEWAEQNYLK